MRKLLAVLVSAVTVLLATALPASATKPDRITFEDTGRYTTTDICDFPIHVRSHNEGTATLFYDQNGDLTKVIVHVTETDTFSANGESLTSQPYHYTNVDAFENGDYLGTTVTGIAVKVPLPDGGTFMSAGRLHIEPDFMGNFVYLVDSGVVKNHDAFCSVLAG
jgi:hypothetical protein